MFNEVGLSIAVENASTDLKKCADEITLSIYDDGFYHVLVKHSLIKPIED